MSAAILTGGQGLRMGGVLKPLLEVGGCSILERQLAVLRPRFSALAVVGGPVYELASFSCEHIQDKWTGVGPLGGIAAALEWSPEPHVFVVAGDMPFLSGPVINRMIAKVVQMPYIDVLVTAQQDRVHALHAIYSLRCLSHIEEMVRAGVRRVRDLADPAQPAPRSLVKRRFVASSQRDLDPELRFLYNVNHPSDLDPKRLS